MTRKTFISYKYSDALSVRDRIIKAMGEDAVYYKGENGFSPNMSDDKDSTIWNYLKDMIWGTSVTIVVISPEMTKSDWIEKEISYSLRKVSRDGITSRRNGVVAVIKKVDGGYSWFKNTSKRDDGCSCITYSEDKVFDLIKDNRRNQKPKEYTCEHCKLIDSDTGSYISYVEEDEFLNKIGKTGDYIEKAYQKSLKAESGYELSVLS